MSCIHRFHAKSYGQMSFSDTRRSQQDHVFAALHERQTSQFPNNLTVDVLSGVRTLRKQHVGWSGQSKWWITVLYHWRWQSLPVITSFLTPWPVPDILYQLFQRPALSCQLHLCTQPYQLFLPGFGHPFIAVLSAWHVSFQTWTLVTVRQHSNIVQSQGCSA